MPVGRVDLIASRGSFFRVPCTGPHVDVLPGSGGSEKQRAAPR